MTTRKRTPAQSGTVTVTVVAPHLVYHDGQQRGGTLDDVPTGLAQHWQRHGWATITEPPTTPPKAPPKATT